MAMRKCKDCGGQVSARAKQCPNCGAPMKKSSGCLNAIVLIFLVIVVIGIVSSISDNDSASPAASPPIEPNNKQEPVQPRPPKSEASASKQSKADTTVPPPAVPAVPDWTSRHAELKDKYLQEFVAPLIGSRITLGTKMGVSQEGVVKSITDNEIQIERSGAIIGFTKSQLSTESRVQCFASDYSVYKANRQTKAEKDAFESAEREKKAQIEARRKAEEDAKLAADRKKRIEAGFSPWDGSHIQLSRIIKKTMHDPKSYKHDETKFWDQGEYIIVNTSFRGKNAFGGVVLNWVKAKCDLDGNVIELIEQGP